MSEMKLCGQCKDFEDIKMPNNKLTDSEIVKAFDCCFLDKPCEECPLCDIKHADKLCFNDDVKQIPRMILDLINRQKAENERLNSLLKKKGRELTRKRKRCDELVEEKVRLQSEIKTAKAEAYEKQAEIDKLYGEIDSLVELVETKTALLTDANDSCLLIESEVVKAFAERLKEHSFEAIPNVEDLLAADLVCAVKVSTIDSLLKEVEES